MEKPLYLISATPNEDTKFKDFFSAGDNSIKYQLEHPPSLRRMGWDLSTLTQAKLVEGKYFEIFNGERKKIYLYENGMLIAILDADRNFLGWGSDFINKPRLNPIALIEVTYSFVNFYKTILSHFEKNPSKIKIVVQFKNLFLDEEKKLYLNPYEVGSMAWTFDDERHFAPRENWDEELEFDLKDVTNKPDKCTYEIIKKIYVWFGMTIDKIPLVTKNDNEEYIIDVEKIKKIG